VLKTYIAMNTRLQNLKDRFAKDEGGAALIEYSVLIGLITVAAVVTIGLVGTWVAGRWTALNAALPAG
jgi:pilus assembly protein Flp/PilA